jgi:APA family basic amino acid/polyamine antiporter
MFKRKSMQQLMQEAEGGPHGLRRALSAVNLVSLGIGCMVGAGIFVLTGQAAALHAGPAIIISFALAAVACVFAGLCYAELSSMIPVSGSAYTYAYATMGELIAWMIGWDLILEYLLGASAVSVSWSGYVVSFLKDCGVSLPAQLTTATVHQVPGGGVAFGLALNLPAMAVIAVLTVLLVLGIRESAWFNNVIVLIKLAVIALFIGFGWHYVNSANWHPFIPENTGTFGEFGWSGILSGASLVFFAYIGFDAVSTAAQEAKNPQRDMPIGILGSLAVCTVLYILVSLVATGLVNYKELAGDHPIATAVDAVGPALGWLVWAVKIGAVAGLTSVILVLLLGQPRIFYSMSRDGLLPPVFSKIHPRFKTPYVTSILTGLVAMLAAGTLPMGILGEMVNIGTLFAFLIVCLGVLVLRYRHPEIPRAFRTPWVPVVPILGALMSLLLVRGLDSMTWLRLVVWMAIGFVIFFAYSRRHSRLHLEHLAAQAGEEGSKK